MLRRVFLVATALGLVWSSFNQPSAADEPKLRVLVVTGGHGFQAEPFFALFDAIPSIVVTRATYPAVADQLKPSLADQQDVIVFYDMWTKPLTQQQKEGFVGLLKRGIGVVALHHTLAAHPDWPEYAKIIGGRYFIHPTKWNGRIYKSSYAHGQDVRVHIEDAHHPITRGLTDFTIHDETYKDYYTDPRVHVLLTTDHPKSDRELAWTLQYQNSRVFYLQLGHDRFAYENPAYRTLVSRGIWWVAGRLK